MQFAYMFELMMKAVRSSKLPGTQSKPAHAKMFSNATPCGHAQKVQLVESEDMVLRLTGLQRSAKSKKPLSPKQDCTHAFRSPMHTRSSGYYVDPGTSAP